MLRCEFIKVLKTLPQDSDISCMGSLGGKKMKISEFLELQKSLPQDEDIYS